MEHTHLYTKARHVHIYIPTKLHKHARPHTRMWLSQ